MKGLNRFFIALAFIAGITTGCNKCTESGTVTISPDLQYITITYLDPNGVNYVNSIFNLSNVQVLYADMTQNNPSYIPYPYTEDFSDGMIGPLPYTTSPAEALKGVPYSSQFLIKRDTYGWDTLRVDFVAQVDECKEYWSEISYYLNGDSLGQYQNQEILNLTIVIP